MTLYHVIYSGDIHGVYLLVGGLTAFWAYPLKELTAILNVLRIHFDLKLANIHDLRIGHYAVSRK